MNTRLDKQILMRWCFWFFFGNVILFWLIGLNYLPTISWLDSQYLSQHSKSALRVFASLAYVGHLGFISLLPCLAFVLLAKFFPKRRLIISSAILFATFMILWLIVDVLTYKLYRFHLNGVIMDLAIHGLSEEVFGFSINEILLCIGVVILAIAVELFYAFIVWRYFLTNELLHGAIKWIVVIVGLSLYLSYSMIMYSSGHLLNRVFVDVSRFLPFYTEVFGAILPTKNGRMVIERLAEMYLIQPKKINAPLNYPLQALQCEAKRKKLNLIVIVIDTWRFDMLNSLVTPTITSFSKKAWVFNNHFSGGNSTGPGIFTLFYGVPSTYWTAMEAQQRGPLLIDELVKQHYLLTAFSSAELSAPPFHRTVLRAIPNLYAKQQPGKDPAIRDTQATEKFLQFIKTMKPNKQPFFTFLFYDAAHSYCAHNKDLKPYLPVVKHCNRMELTNQTDPIPYFNRYKNALLLVDQQIKQVLAALKSKHLLDNTVIVITGDHGEEFNDNHQGYWGHASNFTHYQTQTPLVIYWPGEKPRTFSYQTSHFDVAPTLMNRLLGCSTSPNNFSLGSNLLSPADPKYLIIGSYTAFGIVEPDRITHISPTGNFRVEELDGQPYPRASLNIPTMQHVFQDLRRFYKPKLSS